ncbi:GTPase-activating protein RGD2 CYBJADRAFT_128138 [Cyberlindnera jadinii NRRL Y-1542]|uniref:Rho-GAP domain-containing protein n=1 Tax=Cyberlindnera jadinii (strain ATCC 18201 / CBS 1600 / BCRC 20928 / JCM 3617 / NBRC 0987 / NRRL Y-1542) TaxID=983966 RepID=A0A1E4S0K1_CYBJN|nr:hypothetical protein CYBJADRAFT_128138 [Cyberlindnera jadinii NRRL Y-1542]ODV73019.1 hypothetical protein CYBJADRAFT_128138 [Cyberlindnera jadinii NRRL Y-1542]
MPTFADSFWTRDFHTGISTLFAKLNQGCVENEEFISLFTARMEGELDYGARLTLVEKNNKPLKTGFDRDDGASLKNAFKGIAEQMVREGETHYTIGTNIRQMVVDPFTKWSEEHAQRVHYSEAILNNSLKVYNTKYKVVEKVSKKYFNKCRVFETLKHGMTEEEVVAQLSLEEEEDDDKPVSIGKKDYKTSELKQLLADMLQKIPQTQIKVTLLGTYDHVSTGSQIAEYLQKTLQVANLDECEMIGNDLIHHGYLRKVNTSVGSTIGQANTFVNSGSFHYQWKELAYHLANLPIDSNGTDPVYPSKMTNYIDDLKSTFEEPSLTKLNKDIKELDQVYRIEVQKLDKIRCDLEELMIDHLTFMEKCELDRLRALKKVILDFTACISNNITQIKSSIDQILVYEESISPTNDLLFLLQNYRTGPFEPRVIMYENYYDSPKQQIFGVSLETRCKNDTKNVPIIVSSILSYMDTVYPNLPDDDVRTKIWLIPVRLQSTHALRSQIEQVHSDGLTPEFWSNHPPEVIASVLKLYLLELPDSLVSSSVYDVIKLIYQQYPNDEDQRILGVSNVLKDLDKSQLATVNVICTHFQRLISILRENTQQPDTTLAENFEDGISQEFSSCILRPKQNTNVTMGDRHPFRLVHDLLTHKKEVMRLVKRSASVKSSSAPMSSSSSEFSTGSGSNSGVKRKDSTLQYRLKQAVEAQASHESSRTPSASQIPQIDTIQE